MMISLTAYRGKLELQRLHVLWCIDLWTAIKFVLIYLLTVATSQDQNNRPKLVIIVNLWRNILKYSFIAIQNKIPCKTYMRRKSVITLQHIHLEIWTIDSFLTGSLVDLINYEPKCVNSETILSLIERVYLDCI